MRILIPTLIHSGLVMVTEATTATTCGLRAEDSAELRWALMACAEPVEGVGPAQLIPIMLGLRRAQSNLRSPALASLSGLRWWSTGCQSAAESWLWHA